METGKSLNIYLPTGLIIEWVERHKSAPVEPTNNWRLLPGQLAAQELKCVIGDGYSEEKGGNP
jgi:hypothetical protein